jgi:hypothetical protein
LLLVCNLHLLYKCFQYSLVLILLFSTYFEATTSPELCAASSSVTGFAVNTLYLGSVTLPHLSGITSSRSDPYTQIRLSLHYMTFLFSNFSDCLMCSKLMREDSCRSPYFLDTKANPTPPLPITKANPSSIPAWGYNQHSAGFVRYSTTASAELPIFWLCHDLNQSSLPSSTHSTRLGIGIRGGPRFQRRL